MKPETDHGVVVACDVPSLEELDKLVEETYDVNGVVGYKLGKVLATGYGLPDVTERVRDKTDKSIIYDGQKEGTDIPRMGEKFAGVLDKADVDFGILFPMAGINTEKAYIHSLQESCIEPIVGGEMTHPGYLVNGGGFIADGAPARMYRIAGEEGVQNFVIPGNDNEKIEEWVSELSDQVEEPVIWSPGFGHQGGDVREGIEAAKKANPDVNFYAIIGSGIYKQPIPEDADYRSFKDSREAAQFYGEEALSFED